MISNAYTYAERLKRHLYTLFRFRDKECSHEREKAANSIIY